MKPKEIRPVINLSKSTTDILLELATLIILAICWIITIYNLKILPESIVSHFDLHGNPDKYSSKYFLFFIPALQSLLIILLFTLNHYPHKFNYLETITPQNAEKIYKQGVRMMRIVNLSIAIFLTGIQYFIVQSAINQRLSKLFLPILLIIVVLAPIFAAFILTRNKKNRQE